MIEGFRFDGSLDFTYFVADYFNEHNINHV